MAAGADFIRASFRSVELSPFAATVADILGDWQRGLYHMDQDALRKADWSDDRMVKVKLSHECGGLATYDFDGLTQLVLLAHHHCVRIAIHPGGPRSLWLVFHPRSRDGEGFGMHPTIEESLEGFHAKQREVEAAKHAGWITA